MTDTLTFFSSIIASEMVGSFPAVSFYVMSLLLVGTLY